MKLKLTHNIRKHEHAIVNNTSCCCINRIHAADTVALSVQKFITAAFVCFAKGVTSIMGLFDIRLLTLLKKFISVRSFTKHRIDGKHLLHLSASHLSLSDDHELSNLL